MKKWNLYKKGLLVVMITSFFLLTGCVKGTFHVTVHSNGSADFNYKLAIPSSLVTLMSELKDNPMDQVKKEAEKDGYKVTPYRSGNLVGFEATKHIENILEMDNEPLIHSMQAAGKSEKKPSGANILQEHNPQVIREEGLLFDTYRLKGNIDLTALNIPDSVKKYIGASGDEITRQLYDQMDFRFLLTLPIKAKESNATRVIGETGKTYEWELVPGKNNHLMIAAELPNVRNWLYLLGTIAGFIVFIYLFKKLNKKKARGYR